jgi:hypothetical protein
MAVRLSALRTRRTLLPRNIIIFLSLVLISVRGPVNPRAKCGRKDEVNLKITLSGIEPATYRFVEYCLNHNAIACPQHKHVRS